MPDWEFWREKRVIVTGGAGFLGAEVMRQLNQAGAKALSCSRRAGCDLRDRNQALNFFEKSRPEWIFNCAANQGGLAYQKIAPALIYYDNLLMGANTMEAARLAGVQKYVNIIAGCAYPGEPRDGVLRESEFEAGPLHATVENYGVVKRAAVAQGKFYHRQYGFNVISLILINLYGPGEHFHPDRSHALAALVRKFYEAKRDHRPEVILWGTGRAVREWTYVADATEGILRAAERYKEPEPLNIAVGHGLSVAELAGIIQRIVGYEGRIVYDQTKSDGALHKVGDITRMKEALDWQPQTSLEDGIRKTLAWFVDSYAEATAEPMSQSA